jgi:hypothetical protein
MDSFGADEVGTTRKQSAGGQPAHDTSALAPLPGRCGLSFHDVPPADLFRRPAVLG